VGFGPWGDRSAWPRARLVRVPNTRSLLVRVANTPCLSPRPWPWRGPLIAKRLFSPPCMAGDTPTFKGTALESATSRA
jgi:hypothetical protein